MGMVVCSCVQICTDVEYLGYAVRSGRVWFLKGGDTELSPEVYKGDLEVPEL